MITTIILTYNEEIHIERCIKSVLELSDEIIIIDSFSSDQTKEIAEKFKVKFYEHKFINQATQFQWALDNCIISNEWILKLDADEYLTDSLKKEIQEKLVSIPKSITGVYLTRQVHFMGKWIKYGGYYPIKLLRLWRKGVGSVEQKWMDEHIKVSYGSTIEFQNDFIDENLNNITWWTEKHNHYATREAIEYLNDKYQLFKTETIELNSKTQVAIKRKIKDNYYNKMPLFFRAFIYFLFRYIIKFGFLDGKKGLIWHFLQGFWYRFLVDAKIFQIEYIAKKQNRSMLSVIKEDFGIKI